MKPLAGRWVDAFDKEFVTPLPYVLGNQQSMIELLAVCHEAEAELWRLTRQDVADLAEAAAGWFRALIHPGNAWELVCEVGKAMWYAFSATRAPNVVKRAKAVLQLAETGVDIAALIEENRPPDYAQLGIPPNVEQIRIKIAQTLEYNIARSIKMTEEDLDQLLRAGIKAMNTQPDSFAIGASHLANVASASDILAPEQRLSEREVQQTVRSLHRLGDLVNDSAGNVLTNVYPFVRGASIGIGERGPYDAVLALENAITTAMYTTASSLDRAGTAVRIAADMVFAVDVDAATAMARADRQLAAAHRRFEEAPPTPQHELGDYEAPETDLFVAVPDCEPPEHDFPGEKKPEEWHYPMAPR